MTEGKVQKKDITSCTHFSYIYLQNQVYGMSDTELENITILYNSYIVILILFEYIIVNLFVATG